MKKIVLVLTLMTAISSCSKQKKICNSWNEAFSTNDETFLSAEINSLAGDLVPDPVQSDSLGHSVNLDTLISRLNNECESIDFVKFCYTCIKTHPRKSEIYVNFDSSGTSVSRIIDILTPEGGSLEFDGIH